MSDQEQINPISTDEVAQQPEEALEATSLEEQYKQLLNELETLQNKHHDVSDAFLRAKAEVENTRRRAMDEETKARKFAIESFAKALLPVKDSLEAALNTPNQTTDAFKEGVETTLKQLIGVFESHKLQEIAPAIGDKMDPNLHQAIAVVPSEEQEPNTIVEVLQKGSMLTDRVLRPAMVIVASAG